MSQRRPLMRRTRSRSRQPLDDDVDVDASNASTIAESDINTDTEVLTCPSSTKHEWREPRGHMGKCPLTKLEWLLLLISVLAIATSIYLAWQLADGFTWCHASQLVKHQCKCPRVLTPAPVVPPSTTKAAFKNWSEIFFGTQ